MRLIMQLAVVATLVAPASATTHDTNRLHLEELQVAAADPMADGEVRKVDPATKKITIKNGELRSLDMPAMTMVFQVRDPAMLKQVKPGDKVRFRAEKIGGAFTVVELENVD